MRQNIFWELWLQRLVLSELQMSGASFSLSLGWICLHWSPNSTQLPLANSQMATTVSHISEY